MPPPLRMLHVSESCNNNCYFCKDPLVDERPVEDFINYVKSASKSSKELIISAREPTLFKSLIELIGDSSKLFEGIEINTNGRMFAVKSFVDKFIPFREKLVFNVSLHASRRDIHDFLTRTDNSWIQATKGILNLKSSGFEVRINTVLTKCNYPDLKKLPLLLNKLGVESWKVLLFEPLGQGAENFFLLMPHHLILIENLNDIADSALSRKVSVEFKNIPFCFFDKKHLKTANIKITPQGAVKKNAEACKKCFFKDKCPGFYEDYFTHFRVSPEDVLKPVFFEEDGDK